MKTKRTRQEGITLIALVITIIVLLILAGVSIATLTGQNGILTQAQNAKEQTNKEGAREKLSLILTDLQSQKIPKGESLVLGDALAGEIASYDEVTSANFTGSIIEVVIDGYNFEVNEDLGIENGLEKVEPENIKDWEYIVDKETGSAVITCYKGTDTTVVIPNYIDGYWVVGISTKARYDENAVTSSLWGEEICEYVENYDSWGQYAQNTIKEIIISDGIMAIDDNAFIYTRALEKVKIPRSVEYIGYKVFRLGSVNGLKDKDENNLKELNLYKNVKHLGAQTFTGRDNITINVEYTQEEIPSGWYKTWNYNSIQTGWTTSLEFKTTINYGVAMD